MKRRTQSSRRVGVLPYQLLQEAVSAGWITATRQFSDSQFQPASIDLRLGTVAYQLRASFLPFHTAVQTRLKQNDFTDMDLVIDELSLVPAATLQKGSVYLVQLMESLDLPRDVRARCNPKSSTGRLDVFTRVITDDRAHSHESPRFDEIK